MIDPLYVASGFGVGLLVGMTGVGGGSLMTPLLILLFGVHPSTAVGTDLLYAAATKTSGGVVLGWSRRVHWPAVLRLCCGSIPASALTLLLLWKFDLKSEVERSLVNLVLCLALLITAGSLVVRPWIIKHCRGSLMRGDTHATAIFTVLVGAVLGVLVSMSSVGAGAVGVTALLLLYPRLPMSTIVGSDIVHAVPLTLVAGAGHWVLGTVDWHLMGVLLMGSVPGILVGSYSAARLPETAIRFALAGVLIMVSTKLAFEELSLSTAKLPPSCQSESH
ncbi:sulfite exporter TauE/SafE family protein [Bradyrhizobium sp. ARR65]|uniref:sulfite exporter TauE/SafE family protein n=1 Tax=Bradyrhizobium sp. ARR65 TaxID=1040989 RepID=UPI000467348B|nr:sulfite exporter TauE/SafE family protein [Bradyrhizobium sp. ARR65]